MWGLLAIGEDHNTLSYDFLVTACQHTQYFSESPCGGGWGASYIQIT